jgi:L-fuculose-phosphate aldolase
LNERGRRKSSRAASGARSSKRSAGGSASRAGRELVDTIAWLTRERLYAGTSGNVSVRVSDGFLVTPSGVPCEEVGPDDLVRVGLDGETRGRWRPSSEWRIHRDLYAARAEVGAIVHTHSTFATAIACLRRPVPAFHYMVAKTGGAELRCARYATYGTEALSRNVLRALAGRRACLLANHGMVAVGAALREARLLAAEVEALCTQYFVARSLGAPVVLSVREMATVSRQFADYGPRPTGKR